MFLSIQFPIADSRKFIHNTGRLNIPVWPFPNPGQEFIRYFGCIRARKKGNIAEWTGEDKICIANRAIQFYGDLTPAGLQNNARFLCAFKHFYSDGWVVNKFGVGFCNNRQSYISLDRKQAKNFISHFLNLPVRVLSPQKGYMQYQLSLVGKALAKLYMAGSTATSNEDIANTSDWWVLPGNPLLVLIYSANDKVHLPYEIQNIPLSTNFDFRLSYYLVPSIEQNAKAWIFKINNISEYEKIRILHTYLVRLYIEHECLRLVLRNIIEEKIEITPRTEISDNLQFYINTATRNINKWESTFQKKYNPDLITVIHQAMDTINPGQAEKLTNTLKRYDLRKNIYRKIENYILTWQIERMDINMKGDSFKNISNSIIATRGSISQGVISLQKKGQKDVADAISQLSKLISEISDQELPSEKKKESTELLKGLTDEANKLQPNKTILRTLGNSLRSILPTVETVGSIAVTTDKLFDTVKLLWS